MEQLRRDIIKLVDSVYAGEKKALVFGEGPLHADLMLIGEAPGRREALEGRPFVGPAGKNLDYFIEYTSLDRKSMYITNTVKFRPSRISPAGNVVNRAPTSEETALFLPFLRREIALVSPGIIVTLGNTPLKALKGALASVGDMHGTLSSYEGYDLFPMYHPAAMIYDRSLRDIFMSDMEKLALLIKTHKKIN